MGTSNHVYGTASALKALSSLSNNTKPGYTFAGWATSKNSTKVAYTNEQNVTNLGDSVLYAKWTLTKPTQAGTTFTTTSKDNYTDGMGNKATIPAGFTVSDTSGEWNIDKGLVVTAPDGSEFVWVPVNSDLTIKGTNKPIARKTSGKDTNGRDKYQGVLYDYSGTGTSTTSTEKSSYGQGTTSYREPSIVDGSSNGTGTSYDGRSTYYSAAGYENKAEFETAMQNDYDQMIESVKEYGGYYVGRYEASLNGTKIQVKADKTPMNASTSSANMWYGMYKKQKDYAKDYNISDVNSSMIWGSQFDGFLNWALTGDDIDHVNSNSYATHNGTYTNTTAKTRTTTETTDNIPGVDRINNIYDLEGNLYEWTLEAFSTAYRSRRGGYCQSSYSPSYRYYYTLSSTDLYTSSRPSLYIAPAMEVLNAICDANGGTYGSSTTNTITVKQKTDGTGKIIDGYKEPGHTSKAFAGWATSQNGAVAYQDEAAILEHASEITGTLYAQWTDGTHTFNANGGTFASGVTTNAVKIGETQATITKYSHTQNVDDTGYKNGNYSSTWGNANIRGTDRTSSSSEAHVVTIPGASSLTVELYYNSYSTSYAWASVWSGSHPTYTAQSNAKSEGYVTTSNGATITTNKFGGYGYNTYTVNGNSLTNLNKQTLTITGDTVTFSWYSKSTTGSSSYKYGYYAIVTGTGIITDVTAGSYKEPTKDGYAFQGWTKAQDGSGTVYKGKNEIIDNASTLAGTIYAKWKQIPTQAGKPFTSTSKNNYTDSDGNKATIPKGFTVSETVGEWDVDTGLVVTAPDGSEFVWVPVNSDLTIKGTSKKIAKTTSGVDSNGRTKYQGVLYNYSGTGTSTTSTEKSSYGQGTTSYREPSIVDNTSDGTGTNYDGSSQYYSDILGYGSKSEFETAMQNDYDQMIESVKEYGGYYVGRYEASLNETDSTKIQVKADKTPMNASDSSQMWYGMYKKQKAYAKNYNISDVNSSMIWGSQYDGLLNWALEGADKDHVSSSSYATHYGTYSYNTVKTRTTTEEADSIEGVDRINNIYDLEGNLYEWTLEADYTGSRVSRGGYYSYSSSPSGRDSYSPGNTSSFNSSRPSLYIAPATEVLNANFDSTSGTFGSNITTNSVTYNNIIHGVATSQTGTYKEPTRSEWKFNGWNTKSDGTGNSYKNEAAILENASTVTGTLYAQWIKPGLYIGTTEYKTLTLDGAMLLSAVSAETPSVTANSNNLNWTSSATSIVDVSAGGGIIKCGSNTGTATVYCRDGSNNLIGQVEVTSTAKIAKAANADANTRISGDAAYNNPTIPAGYSAITTNDAAWTTGTTTQANVNNGLVIMDNRGNQFVWVPVPDVVGTPATGGKNLSTSPSTTRPMARISSGSNSQGDLYTFSGTTSTYQSGYTASGSSYGEPRYLTGTICDSNTSYGNLFTSTELQTNYNTMVASVNTYKGFWMARYEGSWDDSQSKIASIAGAQSSNANKTNTNKWYGLYTAMKNYSGNSSYYTSEMIWGSQWNAMLNWMAKNSVTVGNSTPMSGTARNVDSNRITGTPTYNDKLKNIVDIYGNSYEWTQEAYSTGSRVSLSGDCYYSSSPSRRNNYSPSGDSTISSRPSLYIK